MSLGDFGRFLGRMGRRTADVLTSPFTYDAPPNPYDAEGFTQLQGQRARRYRDEIERLRAGGVSEQGASCTKR